MQSQSEGTNMDRLWNASEIKDLIDYANYLQKENQDLQAKMIMMQAKLSNEESKVKKLNHLIKQIMYGTRN